MILNSRQRNSHDACRTASYSRERDNTRILNIRRLAGYREHPGGDIMQAAFLRRAATAAAFLLLTCGTAHARDDYPSHALKLIVPFAAGSAADTLSRVVATQLGDQLGKAVVVENKPGAGGTIGTVDIARAPADGYTIGLAAQGTLITNQALYAKPGYDSMKDFTPIALLADVANCLVVAPGSPYDSVGALAKAIKAQPANKFSFSSSGVGTSHHIAGVVLGQYLDKPLMHVAYTGAPQGLVAVMNKEVDMGLYNIPAAIGLIRGGKLKPLAVTSLGRSPLLPDVPSLNESGLKDFEVTLWFGIIAPAGVPPERVARLHKELDAAMRQPELRTKLTNLGYDVKPTPLAPPAQFSALIQRDLQKWLPILKSMSAGAQ
jgi:tripartite-type tricarboxylate transporter receptor subunit TctC